MTPAQFDRMLLRVVGSLLPWIALAVVGYLLST